MNNKQRIKKLEQERWKDQRQAAIPSGLAAFYRDIKKTEALFYPEVE